MQEIISALGAFLFLIVVVSFGCYKLAEVECTGSWEESGLHYKFKAFGGCLVETKPGIWIPSKSLRDLNKE